MLQLATTHYTHSNAIRQWPTQTTADKTNEAKANTRESIDRMSTMTRDQSEAPPTPGLGRENETRVVSSAPQGATRCHLQAAHTSPVRTVWELCTGVCRPSTDHHCPHARPKCSQRYLIKANTRQCCECTQWHSSLLDRWPLPNAARVPLGTLAILPILLEIQFSPSNMPLHLSLIWRMSFCLSYCVWRLMRDCTWCPFVRVLITVT